MSKDDSTGDAGPDPADDSTLSLADHQHLLAELDALLAQVSELLARFESTGYQQVMRDDYLALHRLQRRVLEERLEHSEALGLPPASLGGGVRH